MNKATKATLITIVICLVIAAGVVWASNNVDTIEDMIG